MNIFVEIKIKVLESCVRKRTHNFKTYSLVCMFTRKVFTIWNQCFSYTKTENQRFQLIYHSYRKYSRGTLWECTNNILSNSLSTYLPPPSLKKIFWYHILISKNEKVGKVWLKKNCIIKSSFPVLKILWNENILSEFAPSSIMSL